MTEEAAPTLLDLPWYLRPIAGGAEDESEDTPDQTPGESGPQTGTPAAESDTDSNTPDDTDWRERYENLQPEYTRATQEAAQYRQIVDAARQGDPEAVAYLGFELPEEDSDDYYDEYRSPEDEIAELKQWKSEFEAGLEAAAEEAEYAELRERFVAEEIGRLDPKGEFSDDYKQMLEAQALRFEDDEGLPDFNAAHKSLQAYFEGERKRWVQSKRTPQVSSGASPSHQPDLDSDEERRAYIAQRLGEQEPVA